MNGTVESPEYYIAIYAALTTLGLFIETSRWLVLYHGSIRASHVLYRNLLETILFANIRFHDTVSRGRLLNRFGKDFEGIDSSLSDNFGRSIMYALSAATTIITISVVGGLPFICAVSILGIVFWNGEVQSSLFIFVLILPSVAKVVSRSVVSDELAHQFHRSMDRRQGTCVASVRNNIILSSH